MIKNVYKRCYNGMFYYLALRSLYTSLDYIEITGDDFLKLIDMVPDKYSKLKKSIHSYYKPHYLYHKFMYGDFVLQNKYKLKLKRKIMEIYSKYHRREFLDSVIYLASNSTDAEVINSKSFDFILESLYITNDIFHELYSQRIIPSYWRLAQVLATINSHYSELKDKKIIPTIFDGGQEVNEITFRTT